MANNGKTKKVLSLVMALVMVLTMLPALSAGLLNRANAADMLRKDRDVTIGDLTFVVPEAIYLYPNGTSWRDSTSTPFQYYINNTEANEPSASKSTTGAIYWRYATASNASLSWRFVDGNFNNLSGGSVTVSASTGLGTSKDISVSGGSSPSLAATTTGCWIEWCVSFTDTKDNQAKKAYAYTYVYKPYTVPVGGFNRVENTDGNSHYAQSMSWLSGMQGYQTRENFHDDGGYYARFTGGRGLASFASSDATGYVGNSSTTGSIVSSSLTPSDNVTFMNGAARWYSLFCNTAESSVHFGIKDVDNTGPTSWGNTSYSASETYNVKTFDYWYKNQDAYNVLSVLHSAAQGVLTVDTSRYGNLKDIPNLSIGLMATDDEHSKWDFWYVSDYSGGSSTYITTGSYDGSDARGNFYGAKNYVIAGEGTAGATDSHDYADEGVKYMGPWPRTFLNSSTQGSVYTYVMHGFFGTEEDSSGTNDWAFNHCFLDLVTTHYNKANLRAAVQRATTKMAALGVSGSSSGNLSSCYFDSASSNGTWSTLQTAYKNAVIGLTKVDGTITDPDTLANNLNNALNNLQTKVTLSGNGGTLTTGATTMYATVGTNQKGEIAPSTNYTGSRTGYNLLGETKRWAYTADAAVGTNSLFVGYNDTIYAMWSPQTYNVYFNGGGAGGSMSGQAITYDTAAPLTANAFIRKNTLTLNHNYQGSTSGTLDANYVFDGWDGENFVNDAGPYSQTASGSSYAEIKQYTVAAPYGGFKTGDRYVFEFDAKGSGTLSAFFYGQSGYRQIAKAECDNGQTSTASDGNMSLTLTADNKHYVVTYTIGATGGADVTKYLLLRAQTGANVNVSNIKAHRIFADGETVKNLTDGSSYTLTARWLAPEKVTLPSAERPGYNFNGWYESSSGGTKFGDAGDEVALTANKTVYASWQAASYTITYVEGLNGETTSQQPYTYNTTDNAYALKTAAAPTGYTFAGWRVGTHTGTWRENTLLAGGTSTKNTWGDVTLTAEYTPNPYSAQITVGAGGTLTGQPTGVVHGGTYTFNLSLASGYDTETPQIYTENCNYELSGSGAAYTVTVKNVTGNVKVHITPRVTQYKVTVNAAPGVSLTTAEADLETAYNGTVTFTVELLEGYQNLTAKIGSTVLTPKSVNGSAYTFEVKNVKAGVTVDVTAERISYNVTLNTSAYATYDQTSPQSVWYGESFTFTVTMNAGYDQTTPTVKANGAVLTPVTGSNGVYTYTVTDVKENKIVTVAGVLNKYIVHVDTDAGLAAVADAEVEHGSDYTLTLTLNAAYNKTAPTATADGEEIALTKVSDTVYTHTFTNVTGDINVSAASTLNTYDVTITGDAGCTVSDAAFNGVSHGDPVTFTVTLNEGYTGTAPVVKANGTALTAFSISGSAYTYTFFATADTAVTVETKLNTYTIRFVLPSGTELWSTTVEHGETPSYGGDMIETVKDDENHYVFRNEWTPAFVPATADAVYTAVVTGEPHTWDEGEITTQPTCTDAGVKTYTCTVCGATYTEPVNAKGHAYGAWQPYSETEHIRYCDNDPQHTETAAHTWDEGEYSDGFSCVSGGSVTYTCTVCGATRTETIAAGKSHAFGAWETVKNGNDAHYKLERRTCEKCGAIQERSTPYDASQGDELDLNGSPSGSLTKRLGIWEWLMQIFHRIADLFKSMKF